VVRLLLPDALRRWELLWVLPVGACTSGLALSVLGFLGVPFKVNLALVLFAGLAVTAWAVRRRGFGRRPPLEVLGSGYLAALIVAICIVPMAALGYVTVTGTGSDAHLATGAAQLLQHSYPTSINVHEPVNRVPLTWRSKFPIYYAYAGVAEISGLPTWQVLVALEGIMLALAALGIYVLARETLGAGLGTALVAMGVVSLGRIALRTGLNPYYNQTWGYFTMPYALVAGWAAVRPGAPVALVGSGSRALEAGGAGAPPGESEGRFSERWGAALLAALFLAVGAFAYPLALPIPLLALLIAWRLERRGRRRRGEPLRRLRDLYRGRRSLLWMLPAALVLAVPVFGVVEKLQTGAQVLLPGQSLKHWGGDVGMFIPSYEFFSLPSATGAWIFLAGMGVLLLFALRRLDRSLAWGLLSVVALGALFAVYFSQREFGWYFHYKILAFVGPVVVLLAVVGAATLRRRLAIPVLALMVIFAWASADEEVQSTGRQLGAPTIQLASFSRSIPTGASVRLDMWPPDQLWAAYFMAAHRLCSADPLYYTDYPRVATSTKADYVLTHPALNEPRDAIGPPIRLNVGYGLYRLKPSIPGADRCSLARVQKINVIPGFGAD
ncbi:MAG TPA: hypothetical protein VGY97_06250, partial [Solirubrobacteraceae bacterium]|nr:hypothetical protein [Solirubrobacteraceae bacterium]